MISRMTPGYRDGPGIEMVTVPICIDQPVGAPEGLASGYVGKILDVTPDRQPDALATRRDIIIPLGGPREFQLPPGEYIVEAMSPGGDLFDQHVTIDPGELSIAPVCLGRRRRIPSSLGWQAASGNIDWLTVNKEEQARSADDGWRWESLDMALPGRLRRIISGAFAPAAIGVGLLLMVPLQLPSDGFATGAPAVSLRDWWPILGLALAALGLLWVAVTVQRTLSRSAYTPKNKSVFAEDQGAAEKEFATDVPLASVMAITGPESWLLVRAANAGLQTLRAHVTGHRTIATLSSASHSAGFDLFEVAADPAWGNGVYLRPLMPLVLVQAPGFDCELTVLPLPWPMENGTMATFEIAVSTTRDTAFSSSSTIKDPRVSTILGYLASGRLTQAELLVRDAIELLDTKRTNPLAAAVGAYVLIATCKGRDDPDHWRPWIYNLSNWFTWLPDGKILEAWNILDTDEAPDMLEKARECLLESVRRGVPVFGEGVRMLQAGLALFAGQADEHDELAEAIALADLLARRCNPTQAFTTITVAPGP